MLLDFRSIPIILLPAILFFSSISVQMGATPSLVSYPKFAPGPEPLYNLATDLQPPVVVDPISIEAIRQTLALYPFAIDGKNWNALSRIFTPTARANYSSPLGVLQGIDEIISVLSKDLGLFVSTQHLYGTQYIDVCSPSDAVSVTYFRAAHFFAPFISGSTFSNSSEVLYAYGQYQDTWERQAGGRWAIVNRNLAYMGPGITDSTAL